MDVNGTRFQLLLSESDWEYRSRGPLKERGLEWNPAQGGVTLESSPRRFPTPPGSRALGPQDRRGAAPDSFGDWFYIAPSQTEILLLPSGAETPSTYWPSPQPFPSAAAGEFIEVEDPNPEEPMMLSGLTVTDDGYLVVGAPRLGALLVFDLHGVGPPVTIKWPKIAEGFEPADIASASGRGIWVLDRAPSLAGGARVWFLDRFLNVVDIGGGSRAELPVSDFVPVEPIPSSRIPVGPGIDPGMAVVLALPVPLSVEPLPDGSVLVLGTDQSGTAVFHRLRGSKLLPFAFPAGALLAPPHDLAFIPDRAAADQILSVGVGSSGEEVAGYRSVAGRMLVVDVNGNQALAFEIPADGLKATLVDDYLPLRMFTGKALAGFDGKAWYDMGDRWLPVALRRGQQYRQEASLSLGPFDGAEPDCVWHRLIMDGCLPPGTKVSVESRAANALTQLSGLPWETEPVLCLRSDGPEIPSYLPFAGHPAGAGAGTWELLFQKAVGRYLELRVRLRGDGRQSPRVGALRLWYPRFSYLREYLPDVYQGDAHSASFLDRYLANVEGIYTTIEERIQTAQALFDVRAVDSEFLPWLASWLGGVVEPGWEQERSRLFIRYAMDLFRQRGTRDGLIRSIRLATDACPDERIFLDPVNNQPGKDPYSVRIVESYLTRSLPGAAFGDPTYSEGPREVEAGEQWVPQHGAEDLDARWNQFLVLEESTESDFSAAEGVRFPPLTPCNAVLSRVWRRFVRSEMAVTYEDVGFDDQPAYQAFLARRYGRIDVLNAAWNLSGTHKIDDLGSVTLPAKLPSQGTALRDWIQFVSIVLPAMRRAHRFTVLVPVSPGETDKVQELRIGRVKRVLEAERPAHTSYLVSGYWAAFQVGKARLGFESIVGRSSRFVAALLGRSRLAAASLPGAPPWDVRDRFLVGRDRVAADDTKARNQDRKDT